MKVIDGDRVSGESSKPTLTLYRNEPAPVQQQVGEYWRAPDVDAWPVDRPTSPDERLVLLGAPESAQAKAYRVLRHRLMALENPRVIAVTSAKPGEGKTTCAINLALALAEEVTARVLLVEANPRRPAVARLFGFVPPTCFLQQLDSLTSTHSRWTVVELMDTRLHMAAAAEDAQHHPMDRVLFAAAMRQLRRSYDYIVVDTPSVLESADVNAVADAADGVLLVSRAKKSSRKALARSIEQLNPSPILGVALLDSLREVNL
jgi:Mrp family chromosome partitioning ATPase